MNWTSIRPLDGSQRAGFEELCAQLARAETPVCVKFDRTGNPDAGVECYCTLADVDEWGWQAKYFVDALGGPQWDQIRSFRQDRAGKASQPGALFRVHSRDRSDPRIPGRQSAMETWDRHVRKWEGWAHARGMQVEFVWWELLNYWTVLSQPQHIGRLYYWFGQQGFDESWFSNRWEEARRLAGQRYTPEVHVELTSQNAWTSSRAPTLPSTASVPTRWVLGTRCECCVIPLRPTLVEPKDTIWASWLRRGNRILDEFATLDMVQQATFSWAESWTGLPKSDQWRKKRTRHWRSSAGIYGATGPR